MKKIFILIFAVTLVFITYDFYEQKQKNNIKEEKKEISYRIEENISDENQEVVTDEEVQNYIVDITNDVEEITNQEKITENDQNILKNSFIILTDFIFYDGTIKGKTFNDLETSTKEKVISAYETIDSKIESKLPNYKNTIKETSTKTYKNIKDKLYNLKNDLLIKYREEIGEDNYQIQEELFEDSMNIMKESVSPVIDTIVEKSKDIYNQVKDKTSSWYEELKEENVQ